MNTPQIDTVSAGYVFAYDAKTGEVLWTHEKIVEMIRGQEERPTRITSAECEQIRAEAARVFRGRGVEALIAPEGFALRENIRISVEPGKKTLCEVPDEPRCGVQQVGRNGGLTCVGPVPHASWWSDRCTAS